MSLKQRHAAYIAKCRTNGREIISHLCPHCDMHIDTRAAAPGERWDTLSTCPECEKVFFKITTGDICCGYKLEQLK